MNEGGIVIRSSRRAASSRAIQYSAPCACARLSYTAVCFYRARVRVPQWIVERAVRVLCCVWRVVVEEYEGSVCTCRYASRVLSLSLHRRKPLYQLLSHKKLYIYITVSKNSPCHSYFFRLLESVRSENSEFDSGPYSDVVENLVSAPTMVR